MAEKAVSIRIGNTVVTAVPITPTSRTEKQAQAAHKEHLRQRAVRGKAALRWRMNKKRIK